MEVKECSQRPTSYAADLASFMTKSNRSSSSKPEIYDSHISDLEFSYMSKTRDMTYILENVNGDTKPD